MSPTTDCTCDGGCCPRCDPPPTPEERAEQEPRDQLAIDEQRERRIEEDDE